MRPTGDDKGEPMRGRYDTDSAIFARIVLYSLQRDAAPISVILFTEVVDRLISSEESDHLAQEQLRAGVHGEMSLPLQYIHAAI